MRASAPGSRRTRTSRPATAIVSPPSSRWSGEYDRPGTPAGANCGVPLEPVALALGHVDRRAGALREVGDAAEVVEVAVRDQDRGARRAAPGELQPQLGGVAARVDDDRLRRAAVGADDVAVRLERPERVAVDDEAHAGECNGVHV